MTVSEIRTRMAAVADPAHREGSRAFFKEQIDPWGVRTADLKPIERDVHAAIKHWSVAERNKLCNELWQGKFEEGVLACHVYRRFARQCAHCEWKLFERWIDRFVHNWAHCDGVASWLLAACIENEPELKTELPKWTESKNRWKRRASIVALLQEAKKGRSSQQILELAQALRNDDDLMVQKGVGWVLKEAYPKRPEEILAFVQEVEFPRLVLRYAAEKMSRADRATLGFY